MSRQTAVAKKPPAARRRTQQQQQQPQQQSQVVAVSDLDFLPPPPSIVSYTAVYADEQPPAHQQHTNEYDECAQLESAGGVAEATTTTTLSLADGVLRDDDGQEFQLIAINSDGQQELLDHATLTHGDILTGTLPNGMLVNFSASQLQLSSTTTTDDELLPPEPTLVDVSTAADDAPFDLYAVDQPQFVEQFVAAPAPAPTAKFPMDMPPLALIQPPPKTITRRVGARVSLTEPPPLVNRLSAAVQPPDKARSSSNTKPPPAPPATSTLFQCELCSAPPSATQLEFFRHLQTHYAASAEIPPTEELKPKVEATTSTKLKQEITEPLVQQRAPPQRARRERKAPLRQRALAQGASVGPPPCPDTDMFTATTTTTATAAAFLPETGDYLPTELQPKLDEDLVVPATDAHPPAEQDVGDSHNDDGGGDLMNIYSIHEMPGEPDADNGSVVDGSGGGGEWFEEGEMSEDILMDAAAADAGDVGAVVNSAAATHHVVVAKPESLHVHPVAITKAAAPQPKSSPPPPATQQQQQPKRNAGRSRTLASQLDCYEVACVEVPAEDTRATDGGPSTKRARPHRRSNRKAAASVATAAADEDDEEPDDEDAESAAIRTATTTTIKTYKCRQCDKVCKTKNSLHYHFLMHTGERPHRCDDCGKGFFANSALKVHQRLHTGDKPYQCEVCSRAFRQWGDLRYHMSSLHSDEKNHQCEFCGKDFARRYSLVIHRRIHTGERNYKCEFCDKSFRASTYLQDHRRIHTGEKPFECEFCQKKFRVRGDLKRHWNIHTRKPKEEEMTLESLVLEATDNEGDEGLADAGDGGGGDAGADQLEVVEIVEYGSDEFTIKAEPLEEGAPLLEISRADEKVMTQPKTKSDAAQPRKGASGGRNKRANAANPSQ